MGFIRKRRMAGQEVSLDLAAVDSKSAALAAVRKGQLEVLYLLPLEFGGSNRPENVVYVPVGVNEAKRSVDSSGRESFTTTVPVWGEPQN